MYRDSKKLFSASNTCYADAVGADATAKINAATDKE